MGKRKEISSKAKLDSYEESIEESIDFTKMKRPSVKIQNQLKDAANNTLKGLKTERANIRMNERDMESIRKLAEEKGMPYQTLIAHILHLYVTDQLVNVQEVKKLVNAGIISKKTGT